MEVLLVLLWVLAWIQVGGTKGILRRGGGSRELLAPRPTEARTLPGEADGDGASADFRIVDFHTTPSSVVVNAVWSAAAFAAPPFVEYFARTNLVQGAWESLGWVQSRAGSTNVCVEIPNGLLPDPAARSAFYTARAETALGPDDADDDGDGLSNAGEARLGTNPHRRDTDGDGYPDNVEAAYATGGFALPEFDLSSLANLLGGAEAYAWYQPAFDVPLPFAVEIAGRPSTQAVVLFDGLAVFPESGSAISAQDYFLVDSPSWIYSGSSAVVSAYGYAFMSMGYADSQIRAGTVYGTEGRWFVVEWRNMTDPMGWAYLSPGSATFQLAVSEADPGTVHVRYVSLSGGFDGTGAIIGAHGDGGNPNLLLSNGDSGSVAGGLVISYHFGTGTDPRNPDSDGDGLRDGWEAAHGMDPHVDNAQSSDPRFAPDADPDHDGLTNRRESELGTDPFQPDTDGDGMDDGWEAAHGFDPCVANANDPVEKTGPDDDLDGDELTNRQECEWGTDPGEPDTDRDGVNDGVEIGQNSDPADAEDGGRPNSRVVATISLGDHSTSQSEKYRVTFTPVGDSGPGDTPAAVSRISQRYDGCVPLSVPLKPGWRYEVRLDHAGSNPAYTGTPKPDYDYTLSFTEKPANVLLDDPQGLFGVHNWDAGAFTAPGKVATVTVYKVDVEICAPNGDDWTELDASRVVLDDEELRIKVTIAPQMASLADCRRQLGDSIQIKTSGTCPQGTAVSLDGAAFANAGGTSEIRVVKTFAQLRALGLLPTQDDDGVSEMAWLDMASGPGQSLADSEAFAGLGYEDRGTSCLDASKTLKSTPPNSVPSESYFKAAGREIVTASFGGAASGERQIMNQADVFYFSGHGNHATGGIQGGFTPSMVSQYWSRDLNCAIIAGCAVLDVRNYRFNSLGLLYRWKHREWKGSCPGEIWEGTNVKYLLGYALKAPLDNDGGSSIASAFVGSIKSGKDIITSWRDANDTAKGRNACVIDCSKTPHEFWFWDESSGSPVWTKQTKGTTSW